MRILAILSNIAAIIVLAMLFIEDTPSGDELIYVAPLTLAPILSLIALVVSGDSWIGLYFKRKALEEKTKIEKLNNECTNS